MVFFWWFHGHPHPLVTGYHSSLGIPWREQRKVRAAEGIGAWVWDPSGIQVVKENIPRNLQQDRSWTDPEKPWASFFPNCNLRGPGTVGKLHVSFLVKGVGILYPRKFWTTVISKSCLYYYICIYIYMYVCANIYIYMHGLTCPLPIKAHLSRWFSFSQGRQYDHSLEEDI